MNLDQALTDLSSRLEIDPATLIAYASEDTIGGYHSDPAQCRFPIGSSWGVEGQVLYAVCRALRPDHVIEIGTFRGSGATHILSALHRNEHGHLTCIDIQGCGDLIPEPLLDRCTRLVGRGQDVIPTLDHDVQVVFEDASHAADDVEQILRAATEHLSPKIVLSHDAEHFLVGKEVREGWRRVFGSAFETVLIPPSDCGLGYKVF